MLEFVDVECPACGEPLQLAIDPGRESQSYVEDCQVCCRPMQVRVHFDEDGMLAVEVSNDAAS